MSWNQVKLPMSNQRSSLLSYALRLLNLRARFTPEIEGKLLEKAVELNIPDPENLINQIITDLTKDGFLNDEKLFSSFITYQLETKIKGPLYIKHQLRSKGLKSSQIDENLRLFATSDKQIRVLKIYLSRHLKSNDPKLKMRLFRRLLGRGFTSRLISASFDPTDSRE